MTASSIQRIVSKATALAVVVLPMMIAMSVCAAAQTGTWSAEALRAHISQPVITVIIADGMAMQTGSNGMEWKSLDAETAQKITSTLEQTIARRRNIVQSMTTAAMTGPGPMAAATSNCQTGQSDKSRLAVTDVLCRFFELIER